MIGSSSVSSIEPTTGSESTVSAEMDLLSPATSEELVIEGMEVDKLFFGAVGILKE